MPSVQIPLMVPLTADIMKLVVICQHAWHQLDLTYSFQVPVSQIAMLRTEFSRFCLHF